MPDWNWLSKLPGLNLRIFQSQFDKFLVNRGCGALEVELSTVSEVLLFAISHFYALISL